MSDAPNNPDKPAPGPDKFTPDYRIVIVSSLGIFGLLLTLLFLGHERKNAPNGTLTGSVFHEIGYWPRDAVARAASCVTDSLATLVENNRAQLQIYLASSKSTSNADSQAHIKAVADTLIARIKRDSASVELMKNIKKNYEDSSLNDTAGLATINRALHFRLTPDDLVKWDESYDTLGRNWFVHVPYHAKFTVNSQTYYYHDNLDLIIRSYTSNMQFIERYPGAGIWVFLQLLFGSFCFIAGSAALYLRKQVATLYKPTEKPDRYGYWLTALGVAITLTVLYYLLAITFIDEMPVKRLFFMRTLDSVLLYVNVIGGIAGAFCLAGFIYSASVLGYFVKANVQTNDTLPHCDFAQLLGFFHRFFILSAILLSLAVLCTGALYNAANSMDFVKLLNAKWGYSPAGGDAVYLYGGLYTAILLLIYLPAKMQFDVVRSQLPPDARLRDEDDNKLYSFLQQPFSLLKGGLIAATPFLTGILQSLMNMIFNH